MDDPAGIPAREDCTVAELLRRWAAERPDRNFLEFVDGTAWTFPEALDRVARAAAGTKGTLTWARGCP
jgi:acyl-CoA synthetase (AMP-forming)/AMP-acid ligase II